MQNLSSKAGVERQLSSFAKPVVVSVLRSSELSASDGVPRNWQSLGDVTASVLGRLKVVKSAA